MDENLPPQNEPENKLLSDEYEAFCAALDMLYIPGNLSGRLQFMNKWPAAAKRVFGGELIGFDTQGTTDKERRAVLEQEASERRLALLDLARTVEEKSVDKGALQSDYVEALIKDLGRALALLIYAPAFVDRFAPPGSEDEDIPLPDGPITFEDLKKLTENY